MLDVFKNKTMVKEGEEMKNQLKKFKKAKGFLKAVYELLNALAELFFKLLPYLAACSAVANYFLENYIAAIFLILFATYLKTSEVAELTRKKTITTKKSQSYSYSLKIGDSLISTNRKEDISKVLDEHYKKMQDHLNQEWEDKG